MKRREFSTMVYKIIVTTFQCKDFKLDCINTIYSILSKINLYCSTLR